MHRSSQQHTSRKFYFFFKYLIVLSVYKCWTQRFMFEILFFFVNQFFIWFFKLKFYYDIHHMNEKQFCFRFFFNPFPFPPKTWCTLHTRVRYTWFNTVTICFNKELAKFFRLKECDFKYTSLLKFKQKSKLQATRINNLNGNKYANGPPVLKFFPDRNR